MPRFQIIYGNKESSKEKWRRYIHYDTNGNRVQEWDNPQEPNGLVKSFNQMAKTHGHTYAYMLNRLPDAVDYLMRETAREDYKPFEIQGEEFHCAELKTDGTISYFNTIYDAYDNRRSNMKVGRYLRKYTSKNDNEIAEICARYGFEFRDAVVHFARTREEIRHVYENGPNSCMSSDARGFALGGNIHPAEAYASGDFEIAYLIRDDNITARTVVVPSKKIYVGIYGDYVRMKSALEELGYNRGTDHTDYYGLRFLIIPHENKLALPYLDMNTYVAYDEKKEFLVCAPTGACYSEYGYIYDDLTCADDEDYDDYGYDDY